PYTTPFRSVDGEALELLRQVRHVPPPRDQGGFAVARVVPAAAVVVSAEGRPARHRLHRGHPEPLVPGGTKIDGAPAVELLERRLWWVPVVLVVRGRPAPRLDAATHQRAPRVRREHP